MRFIAPMALLALVVAGPAQAQDGRVETDTNLICDTPQQIERFVSLFKGDAGSAEAAIEAVNAENTTDACVIATTDFRRVGPVASVRNGETSFDVLRIVVVGVYTLNGLERSQPTELYTLIPREESDTVGQRP